MRDNDIVEHGDPGSGVCWANKRRHTCTDVIEPFLVVVILSCMVPMSVARVG